MHAVDAVLYTGSVLCECLFVRDDAFRFGDVAHGAVARVYFYDGCFEAAEFCLDRVSRFDPPDLHVSSRVPFRENGDVGIRAGAPL